MIDILENFTVSEIATMAVAIFASFKGLIVSWEWSKERWDKIIDANLAKNKDSEKIEKIEQDLQSKYDELSYMQENIINSINELGLQISRLIESDRDSIKAYITERHERFCFEQGWIDNYSLECIEKRYEHYKAAGGNSFICDFMRDIRNLPRRAPKK